MYENFVANAKNVEWLRKEIKSHALKNSVLTGSLGGAESTDLSSYRNSNLDQSTSDNIMMLNVVSPLLLVVGHTDLYLLVHVLCYVPKIGKCV